MNLLLFGRRWATASCTRSVNPIIFSNVAPATQAQGWGWGRVAGNLSRHYASALETIWSDSALGITQGKRAIVCHGYSPPPHQAGHFERHFGCSFGAQANSPCRIGPNVSGPAWQVLTFLLSASLSLSNMFGLWAARLAFSHFPRGIILGFAFGI